MKTRMAMLGGCLLLALAPPARAYIGPGVGITLIGWVVGFFVATSAALGAIVFWPLRRLFDKGRRRGRTVEPEGDSDESNTE